MISKEIIADRKAFYLQEGKIELKNAMDYLNAHCGTWTKKEEIIHGEILNRAQVYMIKAEAMEELLKIGTKA